MVVMFRHSAVARSVSPVQLPSSQPWAAQGQGGPSLTLWRHTEHQTNQDCPGPRTGGLQKGFRMFKDGELTSWKIQNNYLTSMSNHWSQVLRKKTFTCEISECVCDSFLIVTKLAQKLVFLIHLLSFNQLNNLVKKYLQNLQKFQVWFYYVFHFNYQIDLIGIWKFGESLE